MTLLAPSRRMPEHAVKKFQGVHFSVWQWEQELYDGTKTTFEGIQRPDYACVVGVTEDKKILLAHDEQPHRPPVLTPPGGRVEEGEDPAIAAIRELEEETGYTATSTIPWFAYQPNARAYMTCHFFIAKKIAYKQPTSLEAGEKVTIQLYSFEDFINLGQNPALRDLLLRVKLLEAQIDPKKKEELRTLFYAR